VKPDGSKLTHHSGNRFKLFPFIANNNSEPVRDLKVLIGRYLSQIEGREPLAFTADELITKMKHDSDTDIELGKEEIFEQVVRHMFFDKDGNIRPINLRMLAQIPCTEPRECKLADYLVDVLGDIAVLQQFMFKANETLDAQSNALEKFAASKLESKPTTRKAGNEYQRITNAVQKKFESDFEYILGARNRTRDYLIPLIEFYYFTYTAQAILQLNRFLEGNRKQCVPLYFCLEWEKTSQNRQCFNEGWNLLQEALKRIFAHAIVLEILNQTEVGTSAVDYITLNELINSAPGEDHRIAEEIKVEKSIQRTVLYKDEHFESGIHSMLHKNLKYITGSTKDTIPTFYIHDERIKQLFINVCNPLEEIKSRLLGVLAVVTENGFRFNFSVDKVEFRSLTEEELARQVEKYQRADGQYVFRGAFLPQEEITRIIKDKFTILTIVARHQVVSSEDSVFELRPYSTGPEDE